MSTTLTVVWGEALPLDLSVAATPPDTPPDLAVTPVTLVLDRQATPLRRDYRWRPGGTSDPAFSLANGVLRFDLTSTRAAAELSPGNWRLYICVGPVATTQDAVGALTLVVEGPPAGVLPTTDPGA